MLDSKFLLKLCMSALTFIPLITLGLPAMSYEEPEYKIVRNTEIYEVRLYAQRTVAQVSYGEEDSGFKALFNYISGANQSLEKVKMTIPVTQLKKIKTTVSLTQSNDNGDLVMRFFLPKKYSKKNAPRPSDPRVKIVDLPKGRFAVLSYSGFTSDDNFKKHYSKLKTALKRDGLKIIGPPIKATYNSPFTLPFLRRNEAMFRLE